MLKDLGKIMNNEDENIKMLKAEVKNCKAEIALLKNMMSKLEGRINTQSELMKRMRNKK